MKRLIKVAQALMTVWLWTSHLESEVLIVRAWRSLFTGWPRHLSN